MIDMIPPKASWAVKDSDCEVKVSSAPKASESAIAHADADPHRAAAGRCARSSRGRR